MQYKRFTELAEILIIFAESSSTEAFEKHLLKT